jgi:hypothetical protein
MRVESTSPCLERAGHADQAGLGGDHMLPTLFHSWRQLGTRTDRAQLSASYDKFGRATRHHAVRGVLGALSAWPCASVGYHPAGVASAMRAARLPDGVAAVFNHTQRTT